MNNEFRIYIEQNTETTWTFIFENDVEKVQIWASEFMNPIGSLFYNLRMILKNVHTKGVVSMINEPEENIWTLNKLEDLIQIEILNFKDYLGDMRDLTKGKKIFSGTVTFHRFLNQVVNSLKQYENKKNISKLLNELIELRKTTHNNNYK